MKSDRKTQEQDLVFLSDKPTIEDAIGIHQVIAGNLKQIVLNGLSRPFVVGLYGSWGSGKSSIVEMLRTYSDLQFKIVVVDAWRKDKDNFLRQFVKKLANELLPSKIAVEICAELDFKISTQSNSWVPGKYAKCAFGIYIVVAFLLLFGTIWNFYTFPTFPSKELAPLEFLILTAIFFQWLLPKYSQQIVKGTTEITVEDPAWFRKIYFDKIIKNLSGKSICIVIDNLDRVVTEDALAIIKFIKTFIVDFEHEHPALSKTKITFLIPCDDRELINRIENDSSIGNAADFLLKFVNVSLRIPPLLEQDNTNYIRGLISKIGLREDSGIIENMAFIVSLACSNNTRKPKTILNHFVARYNLSKHFQHCWEIVKRRPDWFLVYCINESERLNIAVSDQFEPSNRMSQNMAPGSIGFINGIRPILDEIQVETWRSFLFLKTPNVHSLIPHFIELVQFALERNTDKFTKLFFDLFHKYPYLVNLLWGERKDNPSRMRFSEGILKAYALNEFPIPMQIQNEIAIMLQQPVTGWTYLPYKPTYELIIKTRSECLKSILNSFNVSNYEASETFLEFLRNMMTLIMNDFSVTVDYEKEIIAVLELRAKSDPGLATLGLKYPRYKSDSVLRKILDSLLQADSQTRPQEIIQYVQAVSKKDEVLAGSWLQAVIPDAILKAFNEFPNRSKEQRVAPLELCSELVTNLEKSIFIETGGRVQTQAKMFRALVGQDQNCRQTDLWQGIYFIYSCSIEMLNCSNQTLKQEAVQHCANLRRIFFPTAPVDLVETLLNRHVSYFASTLDQSVLQAFGRGANLITASFRNFPQSRSDIIARLVNSNPEWLGEVTSAFLSDKKLSDEFGLLLINSMSGNPGDLLYSTIGKLVSDDTELKLALKIHFERRITATGSVAQLESTLRAMDLASYTLTSEQKIALRKVKDEIPIEHLTDAQRSLFGKFFGNKKVLSENR